MKHSIAPLMILSLTLAGAAAARDVERGDVDPAVLVGGNPLWIVGTGRQGGETLNLAAVVRAARLTLPRQSARHPELFRLHN